MARYSATPLAKKLGIKDGSKLFLSNAPENYLQLLALFPWALKCCQVLRTTRISCTYSQLKKLACAVS